MSQIAEKPKHPGGRPTKYNELVLTNTQDYLDNYEAYGDVVPTVAGLACYLNSFDNRSISRETVYAWLNDESKQEFSDMCKCLLTSQERKLVNGGLESKYNSNVVKLMLSKHGYSDSQDKQGLTVNVTVNRGTTEIEVKGETLEIEHE